MVTLLHKDYEVTYYATGDKMQAKQQNERYGGSEVSDQRDERPDLYLYDCPAIVAATSDFTMIDMTSVSRRILSSCVISSTIPK